MTVVGRLSKNGNLLLQGEVDERSPVVNGNTKWRYIRDWVNGSSANAGDHWVEIQAIDVNGTNVALNKPSTSRKYPDNVSYHAKITDGVYADSSYVGLDMTDPVWVIVDLEELYELSEIKIWHYHADGRTYYDTKTEVSMDGTNWYLVFDSAVDGTYAETSTGKTHQVPYYGLIAHLPFDYTTDSIATGYKNGLFVSEYNVQAAYSTYGHSDNSHELSLMTDEKTEGVSLVDQGIIDDIVIYGNDSPFTTGTKDYTTLKFEGWIYCPEEGTYTFATDSDDASDIEIDGVVIASWYGPHGHSNAWSYNGTVYLEEGYHRFIYRVHEVGGGFTWRAGWQKPSDTTTNTIPSTAFYPLVKPTTNMNTTFTPDGIAVEEGTMNLCDVSNEALGEIASSGGWYDFNSTGDYIYDNTPFGYIMVAHNKAWVDPDKDPNNSGGGSGFGKSGNGLRYTVLPSTTYTWSYYIKVRDRDYFHPNFLYLRQYNSSNSQVSAGGIANISNRIDLGHGWYRIWGTFTTRSDTDNIILDHYQYDSNGNEFWFFGSQLEQKSFATSFVDGNRNDSQLSLSKIVPKTGDYTIHFKCRLNTVIGNEQGYNSIMSMGNYYSNNSWTIMDTGGTTVGGTLGFIRKGNAGEWAWATTGLVPSSDHGKDISITITKDATKYYCYYNGVLKGSIDHLSTEMQDLLWVGSRQNGGNMDSTTFYGLSIYNRVLSDSEINKLVKNQMSITKEGNIVGVEIIEDEGDWQLVYDGLATYSELADPRVSINIGDNIEFNEIKITCPHWDYQVQSTTTAMAVLSQPFAYYTKWLNEQLDTNSPKIKFHNASTGAHDVGLTNENSMLFGYGNSWRRITPIHYVDGSGDYMYTGAVPSFINKHDWYSTSDYKSQMDTDNWRETGRYQLTPREFQTIQVWVRINPNIDESVKMRNKKQTIITQGHLIEGVENLSL